MWELRNGYEDQERLQVFVGSDCGNKGRGVPTLKSQ